MARRAFIEQRETDAKDEYETRLAMVGILLHRTALSPHYTNTMPPTTLSSHILDCKIKDSAVNKLSMALTENTGKG